MTKDKTKKKTAVSFFGRISYLDKVFFIKHLSLMIKSGLPLRESLIIIQEQTKKRKFKKVLGDIIENIDRGRSLSYSLARYPNIFGSFYINMIKVGEDSGTLEENLNYLVAQLEKNYALRQKMIAAMIYPAIILMAIIIIGSLITYFILPKITDIFKVFKIEIPLATRILIYFTQIITNYGFFILVGVVFLFLILSLISRIKAVKTLFYKLTLNLPILGSMVRNINLVYFTRSLGILLKSGVPLINALDITKTTLSNIIYQKKIEELIEKVKEGKPISDFLKEERAVFPSVFSRMIGVGEKTGSLEETLIYLGNFHESELDRSLKTFTTIFEPFLLLFVGLVIGFVALAIISPIYEVTRGLSP